MKRRKAVHLMALILIASGVFIAVSWHPSSQDVRVLSFGLTNDAAANKQLFVVLTNPALQPVLVTLTSVKSIGDGSGPSGDLNGAILHPPITLQALPSRRSVTMQFPVIKGSGRGLEFQMTEKRQGILRVYDKVSYWIESRRNGGIAMENWNGRTYTVETPEIGKSKSIQPTVP